MVKIRLARGGMKKRPFYQVIVTDSRNSRDGKFIERIGFLNPIETSKDKKLNLNMIRIKYWINNGAIISKRICSLINKIKKI